MYIFNIIKSRIQSAIEKLTKEGALLEFSVERPKNVEHGNISTNGAMVIAKPLGKKPLEVAEDLVEILKQDDAAIDLIESFSVVAPGFINIFLKKAVLYNFTEKLASEGEEAIDRDINIGNGIKINLEFVSANPTGPMHIGHARSAIYGDVTSRLLRKCKFDVTTEYYINDAGSQIDKLVQSLYIRYKQLQGEQMDLPEGCYPGEYLIDAARKLLAEYGNDLAENDVHLRKFAIDEMMSLIKNDLSKLGVKHDIFTSEAQLIRDGQVEKAITLLESKNLLYRGTLERPKSGEDEDWEPREQLLFKSSAFGDDSDRALIKSDGSYSYFASDVALHMDKINRGYNELYLVLGADHAGYVTRIRSSVRAMTDNKMDLKVIVNQLVNIYKDGKPIRMSKRKGNFVTVDDILEYISCDILRFAMLAQKNGTVLDIDCDKLLEQSSDNPLFYIQYAHTRIVSIIRNSWKNEIFSQDEISITKSGEGLKYIFAPKDKIDYRLLQSEIDLNIIKTLLDFPRLIELSAKHKEPHRITYYLYELSHKLHGLWHSGVVDSNMRCIISNNVALSRARISLIYSLSLVIKYGLEIIGIEPLVEM